LPLARTRCRWAASLLQSYLDGQLDTDTAREVQHHLQYCRQCGQEAAVYSQLKESLARDGTTSPESVARLEAFAERLMSPDTDNPE
jgi:anti-sigma factor RsiW